MSNDQPWPDRENLTPHETTEDFGGAFMGPPPIFIGRTRPAVGEILARSLVGGVALSLGILVLVAIWAGILFLLEFIQSSM